MVGCLALPSQIFPVLSQDLFRGLIFFHFKDLGDWVVAVILLNTDPICICHFLLYIAMIPVVDIYCYSSLSLTDVIAKWYIPFDIFSQDGSRCH